MSKAIKGFTLLEMLVVVIIIGILVAIALPQYTTTIEKARSAEAASNIGSIRTAMDRHWYQNSEDADARTTLDIDDLDIDNPNDVTNAKYIYSIESNTSTSTDRIYTIKAERKTDANTWVQWVQTSNTSGKLLRSANLGGPTS